MVVGVSGFWHRKSPHQIFGSLGEFVHPRGSKKVMFSFPFFSSRDFPTRPGQLALYQAR